MTSEAWVGVAAIIVTVLCGGTGWATYIAWMASRMYTSLSGLRADMTSHKESTKIEHQEIWKSIAELSRVSQVHESRLVRLETQSE